MDNSADINKQGANAYSPLHGAIRMRHVEACELILKYEQVSNQNIESGITMSRIAQAPQIQSLLEKALKKRRKVILVCISIKFRALLILNSPKRSVASANMFHGSDTSVPDVRLRSTAARYVDHVFLLLYRTVRRSTGRSTRCTARTNRFFFLLLPFLKKNGVIEL
jgi:hypothetical protein